MSQLRGALVVAMVAAISAPAALEAQVKDPGRLPKPRTTCGPFAMIRIKVVDAKGAPVRDASVEVLRERDNMKVAMPMDDLTSGGEYTIIDDMSLAMVPPDGARFVVRVRRGKVLVSRVLSIGRSADGCHVRRFGEDVPITLPPE